MPAPICWTWPAPEITLAFVSVVPDAGSNASVALLVTLPVIEPFVVPLPSCSTPAEMVHGVEADVEPINCHVLAPVFWKPENP